MFSFHIQHTRVVRLSEQKRLRADHLLPGNHALASQLWRGAAPGRVGVTGCHPNLPRRAGGTAARGVAARRRFLMRWACCPCNWPSEGLTPVPLPRRSWMTSARVASGDPPPGHGRPIARPAGFMAGSLTLGSATSSTQCPMIATRGVEPRFQLPAAAPAAGRTGNSQ